MQLPLDLMSSFSLPEAVAVEILSKVEACSDGLRPKLARLIGDSDRLRSMILAQYPDLIDVVRECPPLQPGAVDGINLFEPYTGSDFAAVVAFRLDAQQQLGHIAMIDTVGHSVDIGNILAGMRNIFETLLLKVATPESPLILDGSYWSILQDINRMFYVRHNSQDNAALWRPFILYLEQFIEEEVFGTMLQSNAVLASSKRAVSDHFVKNVVPDLAGSIADRALFTVVLAAGEYTHPMPLIGSTTGQLGIYTSDDPLTWSAGREREIIEDFYRNQIKVVYYRPYEWSPAYRLEMPPGLTQQLDRILMGFRASLVAPDILEPYPQFLVDKLCKQIPVALSAVVEGTTNALRQNFDPDLLRKFFGAYRTR